MAPYRKEVYCEFEFLKKFRNSNGRFSPFGNDEPLSRWLDVAKFIRKSHLLLNVDIQTFAKALKGRGDNDTLRQLWKQTTEGVSKISFLEADHNDEYFESLVVRPDGLNKVYLLTKQSCAIYKDFEKKHGVIIITPNCWQSNDHAQKHAYIFKDCGSEVRKGENFEWRAILRSEYNLSNCNAMILIDNYIHKNVAENLLPIIDSLTPMLLRNITFHLTILTERKDGVDYARIYEQVIAKIKATRPQLSCVIELYIKNGKGHFHNRTILTNNVKIDSDAGFSLRKVDGKSENSTPIRILHPFLQNHSDSCDQNYLNILFDAKRFVEQIEKGSGYGERFPKGGTCQNRLINPNY